MRKLYIATCIVVGFSVACSTQEEFIKPKTKKNCPSKQQWAEVNADLVDVSNRLIAAMSDLQKRVAALQRRALDDLAGYLDGDKDCFLQQADKAARATRYQEDLTKKQAVERLINILENSFF